MAPVSPSQAQSFGDLRIDGQGNQLIINQVVQISTSEITTQPFNPSSPYLGLRRFEERHRDLFFGRDRLVGSLLQTVAKSSFLLVAGASGSGKSSVVRAGLIPQLLQRLDPARFRPLVLTPDRDPFAALRSALIAAGYDQADTDVLEARSAASVVRAASELRAPGDLWLVFIDQFEQIFTRCADEATRTAFLDGLVTLCEAPQQEVKVVLAMRADFLDRLSASPRLGALAERSLRLVTEMQPDELRAAIEQPAAHHGVVFESGLVEQILAEVRGRAASLPLLQFMLDLLWREDEPASDRTLNVATYHRIGGVQGALRARADDLYEHSRRSRGKERPPEEQAAMRRVFLRLVDFSGGAEGTVVSRRALRTEFQSELERRITDELIDEALLVSDAQLPEQAGASGGTLEVAHEAMLTAWPRLTTWLTEGREVIVARNRLATDAARWLRVRGKEPAQADEELWTGVRLQQALELRARGDFANLLGGLSAPEAEFLDASDALRQTRARAEQEGKEKLQRAEREKRELRIRLLRITGAALTLFLAIAILAAIGARHEQKVAEREAHRAQQINLDLYVDKGRDLLFEQRGAEALAWLAEAYIQGSQNRDLPILLMQARWAAESLLATLPHKPPIREMVLSADGTKLAVLDASPEASVWELPSGKILWRLEVAATTLAFNPAGTQLAAGKAVGAIDIWNLADGKRIRRLMKHTDAVTSMDFSPDGTRLLSGGRDKLAFVWDLSSGELLHALPEHKEAVNQVEYSPTGTSFVTSARFESIQIWDANSGARILVVRNHRQSRWLPSLRGAAQSGLSITVQTCSDADWKPWAPLTKLLDPSSGFSAKFYRQGSQAAPANWLLRSSSA